MTGNFIGTMGERSADRTAPTASKTQPVRREAAAQNSPAFEVWFQRYRKELEQLCEGSSRKPAQ